MALSLDGTTGISASGNIVGNNISVSGSLTAGTFSPTSLSASGNVTGANFLTAGLISATGTITGGNLDVNLGTVFCGNIVNDNANGVGNIGNSTGYFNTVFAKATSAQYADVAECYRADADYPVGTVLIFGGSEEVTQSQTSHHTSIAGTVSDKPAYVMNAGMESRHVATVALLGRVPCRVAGDIQKGDLLVSSAMAGVATRLDPVKYQPGCIIGKALENHNSDAEGVIEIVVGRL